MYRDHPSEFHRAFHTFLCRLSLLRLRILNSRSLNFPKISQWIGRIAVFLVLLELVTVGLMPRHPLRPVPHVSSFISSPAVVLASLSSYISVIPVEYSVTKTLVRLWSRQRHAHYEEWSNGVGSDKPKRVIVLTPMMNSANDLLHYFSLFQSLTYPKELISLGVLEGDSTDDTYNLLLDKFQELSLGGEYRRLTLVQKDFSNGNKGLEGHERHGFEVQGRRRSVQAKVRNHLVSTALYDEDIVLWIDSDLRQYPADIIERMLDTGERMVSADCIASNGYCYDRNNWRETPDSLVVKSQLPAEALMFEGYPHKMKTYRQSLCDIDPSEGELVELHGVGGTALMIEADLFREGLFFPTFSFEHALETEGIAQVAIKMGVKVYGMTRLKVFHEH